MNGRINLYGRARRLALIKNITIIIGCIIVIILLVKAMFFSANTQVIVDEYDQLKDYFLSKGFTCESLSLNGSKCVSNATSEKTTFYRYTNGFEYSIKTDSYSLYIVHRLDKEDKMEFVTTSEAFEGYKNQRFTCTYEKSVLSNVLKCVSEKDSINLDIKSYLGVIEHAQADITNAINFSGFSLENLLVNYEWSKK